MPTTGPHKVAFAIRGPIARADLPGLCDRVCALLRTSGDVVACDVAGVAPDAVTVEALARLQLAARRLGCEVRLRNPSVSLLEVVELMGLTHVLAEGVDCTLAPMTSSHSGRLPCTTTSKEDEMSASRQMFVNLAVEDLERSVDFFTKLGFEFDPRFTDETATSMIVGEGAYVMLLTKPKFSEFTPKPLVDPAAQTEVLIAISAQSREGVDELTDAALAAGGSAASDPLDYGFMYSRSFQDPDGHIWEVLWMDLAAAEEAAREGAANAA